MRCLWLPAGVALLIGLALGSASAAVAPNTQEHAPMLVDRFPPNIWPGERAIGSAEYLDEQRSLRADVAHFLKGRFRVTMDRLFVIPPYQGTLLTGAKFQFGGPSQFQKIDSVCIINDRIGIRIAPDALTGDPQGKTLLTVGVTQSGEKIYTAVALHYIPDSKDELIGYFQLEPLINDPAKGL